MSPRLVIREGCPFCEDERFYSASRGFLTVGFVCRHPDNDGCWCGISPQAETYCFSRLEDREIERRPVAEVTDKTFV
jgi:hypothetical protein